MFTRHVPRIYLFFAVLSLGCKSAPDQPSDTAPSADQRGGSIPVAQAAATPDAYLKYLPQDVELLVIIKGDPLYELAIAHGAEQPNAKERVVTTLHLVQRVLERMPWTILNLQERRIEFPKMMYSIRADSNRRQVRDHRTGRDGSICDSIEIVKFREPVAEKVALLLGEPVLKELPDGKSKFREWTYKPPMMNARTDDVAFVALLAPDTLAFYFEPKMLSAMLLNQHKQTAVPHGWDGSPHVHSCDGFYACRRYTSTPKPSETSLLSYDPSARLLEFVVESGRPNLIDMRLHTEADRPTDALKAVMSAFSMVSETVTSPKKSKIATAQLNGLDDEGLYMDQILALLTY